jgi:uncharacterized phage protein (TIGR02218 family)
VVGHHQEQKDVIIAEFNSFDHVSAGTFADQLGFQQYGLEFPTTSGWTGTVTMVTGWDGTGQAISAPAGVLYTIPSSGGITLNTFDVAIVRVRFKPLSLASERTILSIRNGGVDEIHLMLTTGGFLKVDPGDESTAGPWTSAKHTALVVGTWYNIEFGVYVHDTAGQVRVRLNGIFVSDLKLDNVDTHGAAPSPATTKFNRIRIDNADGVYDDFYLKLGNGSLLEEEFLTTKSGNPKVLTLFPIGPGTYEEWSGTGGAGTHFQDIDDVTADGDTTVLTTGSKGARESWRFQGLVAPGSITTTPTTPQQPGQTAPGNFSSDLWETTFQALPVHQQGQYHMDIDDDFSLLSPGRLQADLTVTGPGGRKRTEIGLWDPAESSEILLKDPVGSTRWYSWGFELPSNWVQSVHKSVITQWYESQDPPVLNPPMSLEVVRTEIRVVQSLLTGRRILARIPDVIGKTHRFEVKAKWSNTTSGYFLMWHNGVQIINQQNFANVNHPSPGVFFKMGVYLPGVPNGNYPVGFNRKIILNYYFRGSKQADSADQVADVAVQAPPVTASLPTQVPIVLSGILAVGTVYYARNNVSAEKIRHFFRINAVDYYHSAAPVEVQINYKYENKLWILSPSTGQQWSAQELNTAEAGLSRYTDGNSDHVRISQGVVLAMVIDAKDPEVDSPEDADLPGAISLLTQKTHRLASLWKIQREDGKVFRFADHNAQIIFDGATYKPAGGFDASARRKESGLRVANLEIRGALTSDDITVNDLRAGRYRNAKITEYLVDWKYPWAGSMETSVYWIADVKFSGSGFIVQLAGTPQRLRVGVGSYYSRSCRYDLGNARCKVNLFALTLFNCEVVTVVDQRNFTATHPALAGLPDDWFNFGRLVFTSGDNINLVSDVKGFLTATSQFEIQLEAHFTIAPGVFFNVEPGCNKLFTGDCTTKYNNRINFGGFPFLPGSDRVLKTP